MEKKKVEQKNQKIPANKLGPVITEEKLFNMNNIFLAFFIGVIAIILIIVFIKILDLGFTDTLLLSLGVVVAYATILFFLLEPSIMRKVEVKEVQTIEKPVVRVVEKPVVKEVVRTVEKPVMHEIVKRVFVEKPLQKLNIPRYAFRGSVATMVYHRASCRLSKSIKPKYKISKNEKEYFIRNKFIPCKICKPHLKKK